MSPERRLARRLSIFAALGLAACGGGSAAPISSDVDVDEAPVVRGVPDKGMDPAVVAIDVGGEGLCTGVLVAADVVLTARHCVTRVLPGVACPAEAPQIEGDRDPATLRVFAGEDVVTAQEVARGLEIVEPAGQILCEADIALLVLDQPVQGIVPVNVHQPGIAQGDHVRTVGFGRRLGNEPGAAKLLREHVRVLDTTYAEFRVAEASCQGDSGGPAFDEADGQIVGIVSRGGPSCEGKLAHNIYTRTDAFYSLVDDAIARGDAEACAAGTDAGKDAGRGTKKKDAGCKKPPRPVSHKPPTDIDGACHSAGDCGTGVCVLAHDKHYCSETCDAYDPCPTHFRCSRTTLSDGDLVCVEK